jgi:hypothetical protein
MAAKIGEKEKTSLMQSIYKTAILAIVCFFVFLRRFAKILTD